MRTVDWKSQNLSYIEKIAGVFPLPAKQALKCPELEENDAVFILANGESFYRDALFHLHDAGFLQMRFKMYHTDSQEKIRCLREKAWENEIKRLRTVYLRQYDKDFLLVCDEISRRVRNLCEQMWKAEFFADVEDFVFRVNQPAMEILEQFLPKSIQDAPPKRSQAKDRKACAAFIERVTELYGQNREKVKPHKEEFLLFKLGEVFQQAVEELQRRNRLPRVAISVSEMEFPDDRGKVYLEWEIESAACQPPIWIEPSACQEIKKRVTERLRCFLRENDALASNQSVLSGRHAMPESWLEKWEKKVEETEFLPKEEWDYYTGLFLESQWRREAFENAGWPAKYRSGEPAESEKYVLEREPVKIEWEISQTAECERLLEEKRREEKSVLSRPEPSADTMQTPEMEFKPDDKCLADTRKRRVAMYEAGYTPKKISKWERENFTGRLTQYNEIILKDKNVSTAPDAIRMMIRKEKN